MHTQQQHQSREMACYQHAQPQTNPKRAPRTERLTSRRAILAHGGLDRPAVGQLLAQVTAEAKVKWGCSCNWVSWSSSGMGVNSGPGQATLQAGNKQTNIIQPVRPGAPSQTALCSQTPLPSR